MTDDGGRRGPPRVKICGLMRTEDAVLAAEAGADYLGAILSPGSSRSVGTSLAASFPGETGLPLVVVLVDPRPETAIRLAREAGAGVIQLHGEEPPGHLETLRNEGRWRLWKAVRVRSPEDVARAVELYGSVADGLLLDGWHPEKRGGSGTSFSWTGVAPLRRRIPEGLTFVAAGGLEPGNVREAVRILAPDVVDVSSGTEARLGVKDPHKVRAFIRNAKGTEVSDDAQGHHRTLNAPTDP